MSATYKIKPIIIPNLFKELVAEVSTNLFTDLGFAVNYTHGTPNHIVTILNRLSTSPTGKEIMFPRVCLVHNFEEDFNTEHYAKLNNLTLLVVGLSSQEWDFEGRYTKVIEPILYPIVFELQSVMNDSGYFVYGDKGLDFTKKDRPEWGLGKAFELNSAVDGIELKFNLELYKQNNCN